MRRIIDICRATTVGILALSIAVLSSPAATAASETDDLSAASELEKLCKHKEAIARLTSAIEHHPKSAEPYWRRALARIHAGGMESDFKLALIDADKAVALDNKSKEAHLARAEVLQTLVSTEHLTAITGPKGDFGSKQKQQLEKRKQDIIAEYLLAEKLSPNDPSIDLKLARTYAYVFDDRAEALKQALATAKKYPHSAGPLMLCAELHAQQKEFAKAQEDLEHARSVEPARKAEIEEHGNMFGVEQKLALTQELDQLNKRIASNPLDAGGYVERARHHQALDEKNLAIADCNKALELDPKDGEAYRIRAFMNQIMPDQNNAAARRDYDEAVKLEPSNAALYAQRGWFNFSDNKLDLAIADYTKAIELAPSSSFYATRARFYNFSKKYTEALADANKALELEPKHGFAFLERSHANAGLGNESAAKRDLDKAHELGVFESD